jgi:hypothetical protein
MWVLMDRVTVGVGAFRAITSISDCEERCETYCTGLDLTPRLELGVPPNTSDPAPGSLSCALNLML